VSVPIRRTLLRVPGGTMLVPMLIGALLRTFAPSTDTFFGSFTGAWLTGVQAILAVFYVCLGTTIDVRSIGYVAKKGGVLFVGKVGTAAIAAAVFAHFLGDQPVSTGAFAGLSTLAVVAALSDTNGSMYMALMQQFGTNRDVAAYSIMSVESGAFITMLLLGVVGLAGFPWPLMLGALLPLLLGIVLGNLDPEMRSWLSTAVPLMVPFQGLALGYTIDLGSVWKAGLLGIGIGVLCFLVSGSVLWAADRLTGGNGIAGIAASSSAGNAVVVPTAVAAANPAYAAAAKPATLLIAACVVMSAILTPAATAAYAGLVSRRTGAARGEADPAETDPGEDARPPADPGTDARPPADAGDRSAPPVKDSGQPSNPR
jgi:2-keto-3-deoxygluconate permease